MRLVRGICWMLVVVAAWLASSGVVDAAPAAAPTPALVVQMGHTAQVEAVDVSRDGSLVLTAGDRGAVLWRASTGEEIRRFSGHLREVTCAAFSPNGRMVAVGAYDGSIRLWDPATGRQLRRLDGHRLQVVALGFSPDSASIVTVGREETVCVWDIASGRQLRSFPVKHDESLQCAAVSLDATRVVTGSQDRTVRLWDVASGREIRRFSGHSDVLQSVAITPDNRLILSGGNDSTARLWDTASGREVRTFKNREWVAKVAISPDGRVACTAGSEDESADVWDAASGRHLGRLQGHLFPLTALAFAGKGRRILTGSSDESARAWDVESRREVSRYVGRAEPILSVGLTGDGGVRVAGAGYMHDNSDKVAWLWEAHRGRPIRRMRGHAREVRAIQLSLDGQRLVTASGDGSVRLWDASGTALRVFGGGDEPVDCVAWSADGRSILTGGFEGTMRLWNAASGKETRRLGQSKAGVRSVAITADGKWLLSCAGGDAARLWDADSGKEVARLGGEAEGEVVAGDPDGANYATFSPDAKSALVMGSSGEARLWDVSSRKRVRALQDEGLYAGMAAFSPDGRLLMTATGAVSGPEDTAAHIWDVATGREVRRLVGHRLNVVFGSFSPDGRFALTGSDDRTARLWSVSTGRELCRLAAFSDGTWVAVDPEGRFDTNKLDRVRGLHWVMPDDPMRPLPLELFMREYYEPRLLSRIMAGERMRPVSAISDLNRVQPVVSIAGVQPGPDGTVTVTVDAESRKEGDRQSGVHDLRLFRDGQMVGAVEGPLQVDAGTRRVRRTFQVRLPRREGVAKVELSAYAFNSDRIKSLTDALSFAIPPGLSPLRGRAYVVAVGVNATGYAPLDLRFAVNDTRQILKTVGGRLEGAGQYEEVVRLALVSEAATKTGPARDHASKAIIRALLDRLAGRAADEKILAGIPGADKLRPARPEDVVVLFFSCHGFADAAGTFYFVLSDAGAPDPPALAAFGRRCVSSEELSAWMRDVDAGNVVLIVDACHSAATVDTPGFKPGPMGSRGLGQMAYDKGMRILAAAQANDVALESEQVGQGLLAYALAREGLEAARADFEPKDGSVTMREWLEYGVARVPSLYTEVRNGAVASAGRATRSLVLVRAAPKQVFQQPSLFDFAGDRPDVLLLRGR